MEPVIGGGNLKLTSNTNISVMLQRPPKKSSHGVECHCSKFSIYTFKNENISFDKQIYLVYTVLQKFC